MERKWCTNCEGEGQVTASPRTDQEVPLSYLTETERDEAWENDRVYDCPICKGEGYRVLNYG